MLSPKIFLFLPILLAISCKDQVTQSDPTSSIITPVTEEKCDSSTVYDGISSISEITDTTAKISWSIDTDSIGYTLFKEENKKLTVIKNFTSSVTEHTVTGLISESNYRFLLRSINNQGKFDCNENFKDIQTTEKLIFISCNDINTHYAGVKPSGVYEIDPDLTGANLPFDVYCDMDNNGGGWTRVFNHETSAGVFANNTQATENDLTDTTSTKYSILSKMAELKRNGKFEFWIHYPELDGADGGNIWTQTSNPLTDSIADYISIRETYNGMYWGGLEKSTSNSTLINGSVGSGWWFYAIGSKNYWPSNGTIPGPDRNVGVNQVQLFIK
jgi:hypothetical protein